MYVMPSREPRMSPRARLEKKLRGVRLAFWLTWKRVGSVAHAISKYRFSGARTVNDATGKRSDIRVRAGVMDSIETSRASGGHERARHDPRCTTRASDGARRISRRARSAVAERACPNGRALPFRAPCVARSPAPR